MAIAVYSRVGRMLDEREISLTDLREELAARYDLHVDARSLDELVRRDSLPRAGHRAARSDRGHLADERG